MMKTLVNELRSIPTTCISDALHRHGAYGAENYER